jgi:anti-sigma-K factor RskA
VAPVGPPPELWDRIVAATGTAAVVAFPERRRLRIWQASTGVALAIAASLAAFIVLRPVPEPRVAVLAPLSNGVPVLLATAEPNGTLNVRPNGTIAVPSGRDLELWALAAGETKPRSLGVLPAGGRQLVASLPPGTQLLVSLEPRGGSPTGQPTGPVLYGGRLVAVD